MGCVLESRMGRPRRRCSGGSSERWCLGIVSLDTGSGGWCGRTESLPEEDPDLLLQFVWEGFRDAVRCREGAFSGHG